MQITYMLHCIQQCVCNIIHQSCCPRGPVLASRTPHKGLGLERKVLDLALALTMLRPRLFPQDPDHVVAVCVCWAHIHGVT